jgi:hypothetical protein
MTSGAAQRLRDFCQIVAAESAVANASVFGQPQGQTVVFLVTARLTTHGFAPVSLVSWSSLIFIKSLRWDLFKIEQ